MHDDTLIFDVWSIASEVSLFLANVEPLLLNSSIKKVVVSYVYIVSLYFALSNSFGNVLLL